jgi:coiled-coil domain-containing protein 130
LSVDRQAVASVKHKMSTLKAARADNFYYPPSYTAENGAANERYKNTQGSLGKRSRGDGELVIRFEAPFPMRCTNCKERRLIAKGVRFNARKRKVGNYLSSAIYSFVMLNARCCNKEIEIRTDPKNSDFLIVIGCERAYERDVYLPDRDDDDADDDGDRDDRMTMEYSGIEGVQVEREKIDGMRYLEKEEAMKRNGKETLSAYARDRINSEDRWRNDYKANKALRKTNRGRREIEKRLREDGKNKGFNDDGGVKLLPHSASDMLRARIAMQNRKGRNIDSADKVRRKIKNQSIFSAKPTIKKKVVGR